MQGYYGIISETSRMRRLCPPRKRTMAQYPSQPAGFEEGPKNPLKGTSVKPLVSASYAQSGVDAGGRQFCLRRPGAFQWHEMSDPPAVETGSRAAAYSLCGIKRLLYGTGLNLHCGATRLLRRERCVQRSLPCVDSSGKGAPTPSEDGERASGNTVCKRGLEPEESCYGNHLGCSIWQIRDCGTDSVAIGYRHRQRAGSGMKGKPPLRRREAVRVENKPDLKP